jgi:hypothetical protein
MSVPENDRSQAERDHLVAALRAHGELRDHDAERAEIGESDFNSNGNGPPRVAPQPD